METTLLARVISRARNPKVAGLCFAVTTFVIALFVAYSSGSLAAWATTLTGG